MPFDLISPDGRPVTIEQPALAVRLRAQGYRDAEPGAAPESEPELSATEPHGEPSPFAVHVNLGDFVTSDDEG